MNEPKIALITPDSLETGRRIPIEAIASRLLKECLALWERKREQRTFPSREAITPREMASYLRNVTLYAISECGDDFEYKVMGDAAVVAWGQSFAGMKRDDLNRLQPKLGDVIWKVCRSVFRRRQPLVLWGQLWRSGFDVVQQETIFLPLGPHDQLVTHILSVGSYETAPLNIGDQ